MFEAFLHVQQLQPRDEWKKILESIVRHATTDIRDFKLSETASTSSYTPFDQGGVVNASAYRATLLTSAAKFFDREDLLKIAGGNLNFVLDSQNADGSWPYAKDGVRNFVDHFHTCFVMKALAKIHHFTGDQRVLEALKRGVDYYLKNLFAEDGMPRPFAQAPRLTVYKCELYDCAECVNLCLLLRNHFPQLGTVLETVISGILKNWVKSDGSLRSRKLMFGWDNVPMHRWAQSQMFRSLGYYLREHREISLRPVTERDRRTETFNGHLIMCGICGQVTIAGDGPVDAERIRRMTQTMFHRGPDDDGYFFDRSLGFGFRRLSIIDLAGGHQPMSDADKNVWIVFNGEIYNYKELRTELEGQGHIFQTSSDTEVIIHGYKQWGTKVFEHLNGMFGVAIWDVKRKRLVVARDAMGIKLIYYRLANGQLTFGSEIRPVLAAEDSQPQVDAVALNLFLRFRYTPSPLTIFKGIRKLAPGTMLVVENGDCREERWYNFTPEPFSNPPDDRDATEQLFELYRAAVKRHLLADVPVGILLSGGLDSGLLLALMNEHGRGWPAYTIGYGNKLCGR